MGESRDQFTDGLHRSRLTILQTTSTVICVVHKSLKTRKRGFDDSSSPSAKTPVAKFALRLATGALKSRNLEVSRLVALDLGGLVRVRNVSLTGGYLRSC
jgi:hypothetical protein